jgi:NADPH2:quinone reductase
MGETYRAVLLRGKGGLDQLEEVQLPLTSPGPGEARIRVVATGAGSTDIMMRTGNYPYRPRFPFVPGYEVVGVVDALGTGVDGLRVGQRVCALTVSGGCADYLVRDAADFIPVPDGLNDEEVLALILNYVTAFQMVHRTAEMKAGQTALVTGANGGVGTALLELLRIAEVRTLGAAAPAHFDLVRALGAEPIPSRSGSLSEEVRRFIPNGVDVAFDGLGGPMTRECIRATRPGGKVVGYGFMAAKTNGKGSMLKSIRGFGALFVGARLVGRRGNFYGITQLYRRDARPFREDLPRLFSLLATGKIHPPIAARLPLLAMREAQRLLEAGGVRGKIVLTRAASKSSSP